MDDTQTSGSARSIIFVTLQHGLIPGPAVSEVMERLKRWDWVVSLQFIISDELNGVDLTVILNANSPEDAYHFTISVIETIPEVKSAKIAYVLECWEHSSNIPPIQNRSG